MASLLHDRHTVARPHRLLSIATLSVVLAASLALLGLLAAVARQDREGWHLWWSGGDDSTSVSGTITLRRSLARSRYSYWPAQARE